MKLTDFKAIWLSNMGFATWLSSPSKAGATKLNPRNNSWAVALGGIPGESVQKKREKIWTTLKTQGSFKHTYHVYSKFDTYTDTRQDKTIHLIL